MNMHRIRKMKLHSHSTKKTKKFSRETIREWQCD